MQVENSKKKLRSILKSIFLIYQLKINLNICTSKMEIIMKDYNMIHWIGPDPIDFSIITLTCFIKT